MDKRVLVIAAWEFKRFFKWKSEIITYLLMILIGGSVYGARDLITSLMSSDPARVVVIAAEMDAEFVQQIVTRLNDRLVFDTQSLEAAERLRLSLAEDELDGILLIDGQGFRLEVLAEEEWIGVLRAHLGEVLRERRLAERQLSVGDLQRLLAPAELDVRFHPEGSGESEGGEKWLAVIVLALVFVGVMTGFGLFFVSITSEKQQRVTEQVVSAASSQLWMDGKLLGITAMSAKTMLTTGLMAYLGVLAAGEFFTEISFSFSGSPVAMLWIVLYGVGGVLFWNCFLAAIAATVSDPTTSTLTPIMFLPILPVVIGAMGLDQPDSFGMQLLSWFPLTSTGVMPMRLAIGDVSGWETVVSFALLLAATAFLRYIASRVFEMSMLIYGKEPSWREMYYWFRQSQEHTKVG